MSEIRLVVREADRDWSGTIHASSADRAIAALSADPVTLEELESAVKRFEWTQPPTRFFGNLRPGLHDEPYDAGLVVIDLAARLVVTDSTWSSPIENGYIEYHDGQCRTDTSVLYHLAPDWRFVRDGDHWKHVAEERRRERAARPQIEPRGVFYGRPLREFVARECWSAFSRRHEIIAVVREQWAQEARERLANDSGITPDEVETSLLSDEEMTPETCPGSERHASAFYQTLSDIHAAWLLTPRDDLNGACPREISLERHDHLSWDMQDRCEQWSATGVCPPGLSESSHAFLHGGFNTHELVKYYDLVRELLWSSWEQLDEMAKPHDANRNLDSMTVGDFLTSEVPRLEAVLEDWFDTPDPEFHGRTPRSIINLERTRIPETLSAEEAIVDPDCPCCQMLADMPELGPTFWHLDGCNNDDGFAFDIYHQTREEWDEEQRERVEFDRRFNAKWAERERLGVNDSRADVQDSVWSRSFSIGDTQVPLGVRIFSLGCQLAELIVDLRGNTLRECTTIDAQAHIDLLNRDFGNLREALQGPDSSLGETLLAPILSRFSEDLDSVATGRPDLATKCDSLTNDLQRLLEPLTEAASGWDNGDLEYPF